MKKFSTLLVLAAAGTLVSCSGDVSDVACNGDLGSSAAANRVEAFVSAATDVKTNVEAVNNDLRLLCKHMGTDLGLDAALVAAADTSPANVQTLCTRVADTIKNTLRDARATNVMVDVNVVPPVCRVDVDAYASCAAECDATYTPGTNTLMCTGGEIRGGCSATCTGTCAVQVNAMCAAQCEGTCSGSCTGMCTGACDGTCSARASNGSCAGACTGTCHGTCSAGCTGTCMGQCVASASAQCTGECRGACSVQFTEPRCTGTVTPPMVNAECRASCDARFNAHATCTPGMTTVTTSGGQLTADTQAAFARVQTTLQNNYATVLEIGDRLSRLTAAIQALITIAPSVPNDVGTLAARAILSVGVCVADDTASLAAQASSVQVSVNVSVSLSASVSSQ